jgi:hypothetical protein
VALLFQREEKKKKKKKSFVFCVLQKIGHKIYQFRDSIQSGVLFVVVADRDNKNNTAILEHKFRWPGSIPSSTRAISTNSLMDGYHSRAAHRSQGARANRTRSVWQQVRFDVAAVTL